MSKLWKKMTSPKVLKSWGNVMIGPAQAYASEKYHEKNQNKLTDFVQPGLATAQRLEDGDSATHAIGDPAAFFTESDTKEGRQKEADAATAAEAARIAAIVPSEDSEGIAAAKRKSLLRQRGRGGRLSTVLTGGAADTLG